MKINPRQFYSNFNQTIIDQAQIIVNKRGIVKPNTNSDRITATVIDGPNSFKTNIWKAYHAPQIHYECQCKQKKCRHIAATILYYINQQANQPSSNGFNLNHWLDTISTTDKKQTPTTDNKKVQPPKFSLLYVLSIKNNTLYVTLRVSRNLKKGGYGVDNMYNQGQKDHRNAKTDIDEKICFELSWNSYNIHIPQYPLQSIAAEELLKKIIETGRGFYLSKDNTPLKFSDPIEVSACWQTDENGAQKLVCNANDNQCHIVKVNQVWYLNPTGHIGLAKTQMGIDKLAKILSMPPVPPEKIKELYQRMKKAIPNLPQPIMEITQPQAEYKPTPCLHFYNSWIEVETEYFPQHMAENVVSIMGKNLLPHNIAKAFKRTQYENKDIIAAEVQFKYDDDLIVNINSDDVVFYIKKESALSKIQRNFAFEMAKEKELKQKFNLCDINEHPDALECPTSDYDSLYIGDEQEAMRFSIDTLPEIKKQGWEVSYDKDCSLEMLNAQELEWFSELEESEYDWFGLSLGFIIDGEKVNLLPLIVRFLKANNIQDPDDLLFEDQITVQTPHGKSVIIPSERFKGILGVLTELYDTSSLDQEGKLQMNNLSSSQLAELERVVNVDNFSWLGSQTVKSLGDKLNTFTQVQEVEPPEKFNAQLRPYQQEGLNWLRFLNEFNLGGILADDMGLGKTVQTLACLTIEKQNNPELPSIIISPTSLVANWHMEIEKFTPTLKTLVLHGSDRKKHFDDIEQYDVILTSYPLILRDEKVIKNQSFNYVILDEAQYIKNFRSKSSKVIFKLKAKHKLCLSGTPMENHLGELWSQFRFLAPGLLGSPEKFTRLFRTPIEKHQLRDRRIALANRIKPFMLRRTKNQVASELPPKTEIIKTTALEGKQRDLYESIRASMDKKVRDAIKGQGFKKSHIIVLDALLKLRQTCCDPRLLSITSAQKSHGQSAKLELLMQMVPSLIEEKRKIIIFSQFTSMIEIIKYEFNQNNIEYLTLTGKTKDRKTPIDQFQNGSTPIIIISLKAGGVGLNLTAADTVIHYDPWWNPAAENQATDRAHRIGQDKPVFVYKLITEGTVEETILQMQEKKKGIVEGLLSENQNTKTPLKPDDLKELFKPI